ncbi:MAG: sugar isomerase [Candidatus Sumerlaeota bacterium]|nr:sugar isomerase [Candidatus Sumerlaeota bacterium]
MNLKDKKYKDFALVREMLETPSVIERFDYDQAHEAVAAIKHTGKLMMTGEGSSRIFPAKNLMVEVMKQGAPIAVATEGSRQAHEYDLGSFVVFGASNSGQTKEVISLFTQLQQKGHAHRFGLTANHGTKLESLSNKCYVLICGKEDAVAATKSVAEQGLFYQSLLCGLVPQQGAEIRNNQKAAAEAAKTVLEMELDPEIVSAIAGASMIYFAGRNNGVAEELTLKTNEITRKKSDFLEGTYAVHGIEEVMDPSDVVIVVDPYEAEIQKFKEVLEDGVKMKVIAISTRETIFPTIKIPHVWGFESFLQLLTGWNVLVSVGVANGVNLDKPTRARKVGNEFLG